MRRQFNNIVSVIHSAIRLTLLKVFHGKNVSSAKIERLSPDVVTEIVKGGKLILGSKCSIHSGCKLKVRENGKLCLGKNVFLNYGCILMCRDQIIVGDGCEFGPNVVVYDHDHDITCEGGIKAGKYKTAPVTVGIDCWIGAGTVILKGVTIGDRTVIGAGSIVTKDVPAYSVMVQKRNCMIVEY